MSVLFTFLLLITWKLHRCVGLQHGCYLPAKRGSVAFGCSKNNWVSTLFATSSDSDTIEPLIAETYVAEEPNQSAEPFDANYLNDIPGSEYHQQSTIKEEIKELPATPFFAKLTRQNDQGKMIQTTTTATTMITTTIESTKKFSDGVIHELDKHNLHHNSSQISYDTIKTRELSRREWLGRSAMVLFGTGIVAGSMNQQESHPLEKPAKAAKPIKSTQSIHSSKPIPASKRLEPINFTQVAAETNINVTMECEDGCVKVDSKNFTKVKSVKVPKWFPAFLTPPPRVIKEIPDSELLLAGSIAGGVMEMGRTSLLYPLQTIKTRIQTDIHNYTLRPPPIEARIAKLGYNIGRFAKEGNLYAGIKPSLLVSVPATGVYYGVRDVSKRMLSMTTMGDIPIALLAALIGDIASLCVRTPADALALRLQARDENVGDWFGDSIKQLPMVIVTDLPYLLSKILLTRIFIHGNISMDQYAEIAILTAILAAFLTTPFDVIRTRILVDSDGNFSNGKDGGTGEGIIKTMKDVMREGRGGVANLYAGWFERVLYLGIGRAWLDPIQIVGYIAIRDALLLEWF